MTKTALAPLFTLRSVCCLVALATAGCAAPRDPGSDLAGSDGSSGGTTAADGNGPADDREPVGEDGPGNGDHAEHGDDAMATSSTGGAGGQDTGDDNDNDDDDDAGSTGAPAVACDEAGGFCAKTVPFGWEGPVTMIAWADEDEAPDCAGAYDITVAASLSYNLAAPQADCTCECGNAVGTTCVGEISVHESPGTGCNFSVGEEIASGGPSEWMELNVLGPDALRFVVEQAPRYPGGICSKTDIDDVPDAHFRDHVTLCAASEVSGACEGSETCMPAQEAAAEGPMCIWKEGDVECPAAPDVSRQYYTERTVVYQDFNDTRACSDCHCENQPGSCSEGYMQFTQNLLSPATAPANMWMMGIDGCLPVSTTQNFIRDGIWVGVAPIGSECEQTGGNPVGGASGTEPVTVCCYEP